MYKDFATWQHVGVSPFRDSSCILYLCSASIGLPFSFFFFFFSSLELIEIANYQFPISNYQQEGMQSRLAEATIRSGGLVSVFSIKRVSQWIRAASSTSRTADPAIHSADPQGIDVDESAASAREQKRRQEEEVEEENPPVSLGKVPVLPSQPKLVSKEVSPPPPPCIQQKRSFQATSLEDVSCVGVDGTPLPKGVDGDGIEQKDEQEYYKHKKPSPLSEVEFVDTRKPITRATDGTAAADQYGGDPDRVITWTKEQLDTAEEALERAVRIWRENAMRGDPESPQSRALRALLGELN